MADVRLRNEMDWMAADTKRQRPFARPPGSVREVAIVMGALLRKHEVIDAAAIDDPEGYDNYDTLGRLLRVAEDWCEWYSE